jgi:hypothetical protein
MTATKTKAILPAWMGASRPLSSQNPTQGLLLYCTEGQTDFLLHFVKVVPNRKREEGREETKTKMEEHAAD